MVQFRFDFFGFARKNRLLAEAAAQAGA